MDYEIFDLGAVRLQNGATLRDCKLAYKTFGALNDAKDNVIVYPTWYSAQHDANEWLIGDGMALDPAPVHAAFLGGCLCFSQDQNDRARNR